KLCMSPSPQALEDQIAQWRSYLRRNRASAAPDIDTLEARLRDHIRALTAAGLDDDEAFLVAVKRVGSADTRAREFASAHSDRLWKQMVIGGGDNSGRRAVPRKETIVVFALAVAAALAIKIPALFGKTFGNDVQVLFYVRNGSFFVLPFLVG